ncbi:F-box domain-containing protein [Pleurotus pulmonarius]|nr:hypothetical protein EYR36_002063 [Pleurotus pulmonarius]KAF4588198.1 hypothetical protein EYR38_010165 [Pleurotus pulmonarius]
MLLLQLPAELLLIILEKCPRTTLFQLLRVNRQIHDLAIRELYATIPRLPLDVSTRCLTSLCFSDRTCQLVRNLTINWEDVYLKDQIPNQGLLKAMVRYGALPAVVNRRLFRDRFTLLRTVLGRTTNLTSLSLVVSGRDSQSDVYAADVLAFASFSLTYFKTTFVVGPRVMAFIERQQDLKELCLASESRMVGGVALPEGACPRLERFNWTWGSDDQLELAMRIMRPRPMRHIGAVLNSQNAIEGVDRISQAAPQLDSAVFTMRDSMPKDFLNHVSSRLPHLIHLKLSLARIPAKEALDGIGQFLLTPLGLRLKSLCFLVRSLRVNLAMEQLEDLKYIVMRWVRTCSKHSHGVEITRSSPMARNYDYMQAMAKTCCKGSFVTTKKLAGPDNRLAVVTLTRGRCTFATSSDGRDAKLSSVVFNAETTTHAGLPSLGKIEVRPLEFGGV